MPSLLEALEQKYFQFDGESISPDIGPTSVAIFLPRRPALLTVPDLLVLNDCNIDRAGDFEAIKEKCQKVRELDLAQNKLQRWDEVLRILEHMPRIQFLNLSKNRLVGPISAPQLSTPSLGNLRNLVLNGTYLDWHCLERLLEHLPVLEEMHLSLNNYTEVLIDADVDGDADVDVDVNADAEADLEAMNENCSCGSVESSAGSHSESSASSCAECSNANGCCGCDAEMNNGCSMESPRSPRSPSVSSTNSTSKCHKTSPHRALRILHFTGNPVEDWEEICRLGRVFPNMEQLVLAECPIKAIGLNDTNSEISASAATDQSNAAPSASEQPNDDEPYKHFPNLSLLNLSCASINTWDDIDRLAKFPNLRNLRVQKWPLWERLDNTEHERRQLLIARLPNVTCLNGGGTITADEREDAERAFIRHYMEKPESERPKRYDQLTAKHGKLDPLVNVNLKPEKHVKVSITYKDRTEQRLVEVNRTVADLKGRLEKLFELPANRMRLFYVDQDYREMGAEEMRFPNKVLYSYNIRNGDEIIIEEKRK